MKKKQLTDSAKLAKTAATELEEIHKGRGYAFKSKGQVYLVRCFSCGMENWASMVASGVCYMCGFDARVEDANEIT